jgi:hypothetical protein
MKVGGRFGDGWVSAVEPWETCESGRATKTPGKSKPPATFLAGFLPPDTNPPNGEGYINDDCGQPASSPAGDGHLPSLGNHQVQGRQR